MEVKSPAPLQHYDRQTNQQSVGHEDSYFQQSVLIHSKKKKTKKKLANSLFTIHFGKLEANQPGVWLTSTSRKF